MTLAKTDVELYGGPADGMLLQLDEDVTEFVVPAPAMTPAQFIALESGAPSPEVVLPILEHRYLLTNRLGLRSGARVYTYVGYRRARRDS